jgi:hypothetical protein
MDTGTISLGAKRPGRETDHSLPTSVKVEKTRVFTSTPPYASWRNTYLVKNRDSFNFNQSFVLNVK